ncbi:hypothetical protein IHE44_0004846, partial [Lamprotornis superbus]
MSNSSSISHFLLLPLADTWQLQLLHFCLFLAISLAALLANGLIISAVACGHHLHTPMCNQHILYISTRTFANMRPPSIPSLDLALSVLYSVVPPALNPLIYSLRNQELKAAVWTLMTG